FYALQDHIRESKESKLDEIDRHSKTRSRDNISRQKHSQTSLQILDDVSNGYYREAVPISTQSSKADFKEKEHSILRRHGDMTQASICGINVDDGESSSTTTATHELITKAAIATAPVNACDMGCQTRESLFANSPSAVATLMRQKSSSSSLGAGSAVMPPPPPRFFSTFGYGAPNAVTGLPATTPPPPTAAQLLNTLTRRSQMHMQHAPSHHNDSLELEERHSGVGGAGSAAQRSHYGLIVASTARPQEICHHHHQHQQHQQQQQQLQQQQRVHHPHIHAQQQQQMLPKGHGQLQTQTVLPVKSGGSSAAAAAVAGGVAAAVGAGKQQQKNEESKVFIDIRNSAPDVIIMTSH
ncbi:CG15753, partial [Drosophila busckii]